MSTPGLTEEDIRRIDSAKVREHIDTLRRVVDSLGYIAPEASDVWQAKLDRCAGLMSAIADGLRLTRGAAPR